MATSAPQYSFCESVHATGTSPWHIRRLDNQGLKLSGGITSESLCGLVTRGWDLQVPISDAHLAHTCRRCLAKYQEQTEAKP